MLTVSSRPINRLFKELRNDISRYLFVVILLVGTCSLGSNTYTEGQKTPMLPYSEPKKEVSLLPYKKDSVLQAGKAIEDSIKQETERLKQKVNVMKKQQTIIKNEKEDTTRNN